MHFSLVEIPTVEADIDRVAGWALLTLAAKLVSFSSLVVSLQLLLRGGEHPFLSHTVTMKG